MTVNTDVLVIGAGPGGYPAAIRAKQLGKKVIIVDKGFIGGECLNWGCIPSKALIFASDMYYKMTHEVSEMGISTENTAVDMKKLQEWKNQIVTNLVNGVKTLLIGNKIETINGTASFLTSTQVEVTTTNGQKQTIEASDIIIATGTEFRSLPGLEIDNESILSARGALELELIPNEIVCIGGGIVGIELGTVYAKLGSKVTIVELLSDIMYGIDESMIIVLREKLQRLGVKIYTQSKVNQVKKGANNKLILEVESKDEGKLKLSADKILLGVGKVPNTSDLQLENAGVKLDDKGFIITDIQQRTNISNIYAVGDCTGMPFLAHRATKQGVIAAEVSSGLASASDFRAMPGAIFTDPEIAFAGMFEHEAKEAGIEVIVAQAPFGRSARAITQQEDEGFVNIIINAKNGVLIGAQIIGPHASDLISEIALALEMGATAEDIGLTVHPHPTLPEMIMEAVESALGKAIHVANVKRKK